MSDTENNTSDNKARRLLLAAVVFALLAGGGTMLYLKVLEHRIKKELTPSPQTLETVVVASRDLPAGSRIGSDSMALRRVPRKYVESGAVTPEQYASIKGAVINKPLVQGKMLIQDYIDIDLAKDFSGTIRKGYRAMTIEVSSLNGISGLIRPGNHIDLFTRLAARNDPNRANASGEVVIPVLENVTILATDRKTDRPNIAEFHSLASLKPPQVYSRLTLEVTAKQAALVSMARSRGSLLAVLRNEKDHSKVLFARVSSADLFRNSSVMRNAAEVRDQSRGLQGIHRNSRGQLVTADGTVITDPNVHVNSKGQLVTADGTVLNGHGFTVGPDGKIRDASGKVIDTASLHQLKDGKFVDKNGAVAAARPYKKLKGGFFENSKGQVLTPNGKVLSGVTVDKNGNVIGPRGRVLKASAIKVDGKGQVYESPAGAEGMQIGADGSVHSAARPLTARSLVRVGKDGVVHGKDGKVLKGWHVKNGVLYNAQGKKASPEDVLLAEHGLHKGKDGTLLGSDGKPVTARNLLKVGKDGLVRTRDGKVLKGWHVGKDGTIYNAAGKKVTAEDALLADNGLEKNAQGAVVTSPRKISAAQLVQAGADGSVRAADGKVLKGWHVGKDGTIYNARGKKATAADVLLAEKGMRPGRDGTVIDAKGKVLHARDLVTVGKDGVVRSRDGRILKGVHVGKDGKLYDKNGHLVTARDIVEREAAAANVRGTRLAGVTAAPQTGPGAGNGALPESLPGSPSYEVEYIIGGDSSNGTAKTFMIQVEDENELGGRDE